MVIRFVDIVGPYKLAHIYRLLGIFNHWYCKCCTGKHQANAIVRQVQNLEVGKNLKLDFIFLALIRGSHFFAKKSHQTYSQVIFFV